MLSRLVTPWYNALTPRRRAGGCGGRRVAGADDGCVHVCGGGLAANGQLGGAGHLIVHASDELAAADFALVVSLRRPLARSCSLSV